MLEVNPRASRTVPFVAKVIGAPIAKIAARIMAGEKLAAFGLRAARSSTISRSRKRCSPSPASPASTRCSGRKCARPARSWASTARFRVAFAKSQLGAGTKVPRSGTVFVSVRDEDKPRILEAVQAAGRARLQDRRHRRHAALPAEARASRAAKINKVLEGRPHIVDAIKNGEVQLVFNTTEGAQALADSRSLAPRRPLA